MSDEIIIYKTVELDRRPELGVMVLTLASLAGLWLWGSSDQPVGFPLDDAWIHMVYGRSISEGDLFAYNPGEPSTGATSLLWAALLGIVHILVGWAGTSALVVANYAVNAVLLLLLVRSSIALARATGYSEPGALVAGIAVVSSTLFTATVFSGMEVVLTAYLLVVGFEYLQRLQMTKAGFAFGLACLARPECALVLIFAGLVTLVRGWLLGRFKTALRMGLRFSIGPAICASSAIFFFLWASGRPLPATYYLKESTSVDALPDRLELGLWEVLPHVAPFAGGLIWFGALGFAYGAVMTWRDGARDRTLWPGALTLALAGLLFVAGNVLVIPPVDPEAFYHQRYLLPGVPLLVIGLVGGFDAIVIQRLGRGRRAPLFAAGIALFGLGLVSTPSVSDHLFSDIRNINELQRAQGEWLAENVPEDGWVATNDAGAVRYFSNRPAVDLMGLNTPELVWDAEAYAADHPVVAIVVMPSWFPRVQGQGLRVAHHTESRPYTVTSNPGMGIQVAVVCASDTPVRLVGMRELMLLCESGVEP